MNTHTTRRPRTEDLHVLTVTDDTGTRTLTPYPQIFQACFKDWLRYEGALTPILDIAPTGLAWRWIETH